MVPFTIDEAAQVCGGVLFGNCVGEIPLGKLVIDSRKIQPGDCFVAYKGAKTDGHAYITTALDMGACCAIAERRPEGENRAVIVVPDVQEAVEKLAAAIRGKIHIPVIGITGSVGKTSAKEMISAVLSARYETMKTAGNLNNTIGVPITLSSVMPEHEVAVVEMGINHFGEMDHLGRMVRPNLAVYTVIGHAHLEFLQDLDGVLRAKTEMLPYMPDDGVIVVNGDDDKLKTLQPKQRLVQYGLGNNCTVKGSNVTVTNDGCTEMDITAAGRSIHVVVPAYGQHLVYAALAGAAVGFELGLTDEEIVRGVACYHTVGRRAAISEVGGIKLIDDCYNANPDSVKCGIDSLEKLQGRHVCILGEMRELGETSAQMHREVGLYAVAHGADLVVSCGALGKQLTDAAGEKGLWYETRENIIEALPALLRQGDNVLVKASLTIGFDKVSEAIKELGNISG